MTVELESFGTTRELNRLRVVDALRRAGTASRSDLARATGLSRTTVASLVADLQDRGLIVEQANDRPQPAGRGRPPVLLRLDAAAGSALGIDFASSSTYKWLMGERGIGFLYVREDLQGTVLPTTRYGHRQV